MELELGLKITRTRDDITMFSDLRIAKDRSGPVFVSRETDTMFILIAHLKDYKGENIDIKITEDGSSIEITGVRPVEEMVLKRWILWNKNLELRTFKKVFQIPDGVVLDKIKAKFKEEDSALTITMPKMVKGIVGVTIEEVKDDEADTSSQEKINDDIPEPESTTKQVSNEIEQVVEMAPEIAQTAVEEVPEDEEPDQGEIEAIEDRIIEEAAKEIGEVSEDKGKFDAPEHVPERVCQMVEETSKQAQAVDDQMKVKESSPEKAEEPPASIAFEPKELQPEQETQEPQLVMPAPVEEQQIVQIPELEEETPKVERKAESEVSVTGVVDQHTIPEERQIQSNMGEELEKQEPSMVVEETIKAEPDEQEQVENKEQVHEHETHHANNKIEDLVDETRIPDEEERNTGAAIEEVKEEEVDTSTQEKINHEIPEPESTTKQVSKEAEQVMETIPGIAETVVEEATEEKEPDQGAIGAIEDSIVEKAAKEIGGVSDDKEEYDVTENIPERVFQMVEKTSKETQEVEDQMEVKESSLEKAEEPPASIALEPQQVQPEQETQVPQTTMPTLVEKPQTEEIPELKEKTPEAKTKAESEVSVAGVVEQHSMPEECQIKGNDREELEKQEGSMVVEELMKPEPDQEKQAENKEQVHEQESHQVRNELEESGDEMTIPDEEPRNVGAVIKKMKEDEVDTSTQGPINNDIPKPETTTQQVSKEAEQVMKTAPESAQTVVDEVLEEEELDHGEIGAVEGGIVEKAAKESGEVSDDKEESDVMKNVPERVFQMVEETSKETQEVEDQMEVKESSPKKAKEPPASIPLERKEVQPEQENQEPQTPMSVLVQKPQIEEIPELKEETPEAETKAKSEVLTPRVVEQHTFPEESQFESNLGEELEKKEANMVVEEPITPEPTQEEQAKNKKQVHEQETHQLSNEMEASVDEMRILDEEKWNVGAVIKDVKEEEVDTITKETIVNDIPEPESTTQQVSKEVEEVVKMRPEIVLEEVPKEEEPNQAEIGAIEDNIVEEAAKEIGKVSDDKKEFDAMENVSERVSQMVEETSKETQEVEDQMEVKESCPKKAQDLASIALKPKDVQREQETQEPQITMPAPGEKPQTKEIPELKEETQETETKTEIEVLMTGVVEQHITPERQIESNEREELEKQEAAMVVDELIKHETDQEEQAEKKEQVHEQESQQVCNELEESRDEMRTPDEEQRKVEAVIEKMKEEEVDTSTQEITNNDIPEPESATQKMSKEDEQVVEMVSKIAQTIVEEVSEEEGLDQGETGAIEDGIVEKAAKEICKVSNDKGESDATENVPERVCQMVEETSKETQEVEDQMEVEGSRPEKVEEPPASISLEPKEVQLGQETHVPQAAMSIPMEKPPTEEIPKLKEETPEAETNVPEAETKFEYELSTTGVIEQHTKPEELKSNMGEELEKLEASMVVEEPIKPKPDQEEQEEQVHKQKTLQVSKVIEESLDQMRIPDEEERNVRDAIKELKEVDVGTSTQETINNNIPEPENTIKQVSKEAEQVVEMVPKITQTIAEEMPEEEQPDQGEIGAMKASIVEEAAKEIGEVRDDKWELDATENVPDRVFQMVEETLKEPQEVEDQMKVKASSPEKYKEPPAFIALEPKEVQPELETREPHTAMSAPVEKPQTKEIPELRDETTKAKTKVEFEVLATGVGQQHTMPVECHIESNVGEELEKQEASLVVEEPIKPKPDQEERAESKEQVHEKESSQVSNEIEESMDEMRLPDGEERNESVKPEVEKQVDSNQGAIHQKLCPSHVFAGYVILVSLVIVVNAFIRCKER